jgi:hypothetical protein
VTFDRFFLFPFFLVDSSFFFLSEIKIVGIWVVAPIIQQQQTQVALLEMSGNEKGNKNKSLGSHGIKVFRNMSALLPTLAVASSLLSTSVAKRNNFFFSATL